MGTLGAPCKPGQFGQYMFVFNNNNNNKMFIFQVIRNIKSGDKQNTKYCLSPHLFCSYNSLKGMYTVRCLISIVYQLVFTWMFSNLVR